MTAPMPQGPPPSASQELQKPPAAPWTPFQTRPNDSEQGIAAIWLRKLSEIISSVEYAEADPAWREPLDAKYHQASQAAHPPQPGAPGEPTPDPSTPPERTR